MSFGYEIFMNLFLFFLSTWLCDKDSAVRKEGREGRSGEGKVCGEVKLREMKGRKGSR